MSEVGNEPVWTVVGAVVAVAALVVAVVAWRRPQAPAPKDGSLTVEQIGEVLDALSRTVEQEWRAELPRRGVDPVARLAVRPGFTPDAASVSLNLSQVLFDRDFDGRITTWNLAGSVVASAADKYVGLPHRQLVVLGARGSGKSIMAATLARDLQDRRKDLGGRVPVLLPAAAWNPGFTVLPEWIAHQLSISYGIGSGTARQLVVDGRIIPILDGLDENLDPTEALHQLNEWAGRDKPFVLTCRNRQYLDAHADHGPLAVAAVIELLPLLPDDAVAYLDPGH
ncbi:MAG TPA: NACHT domain-containing protein, partial [Candidatus Stackebrandtia faecavium]|nr:NACHT domain-containing protein [Candidatus Stackebrandtia faecavium]